MGSMRTTLVFVAALALARGAWGQAAVTSPDGSVTMALSAGNGQLAYTVAFQGKPVIARSAPFCTETLRVVALLAGLGS